VSGLADGAGSLTGMDRAPRCGALTDRGKPCRRTAGAGTAHPGHGPCDRHETRALADNPEAQTAILDLLRDPAVTPRDAAEQHGYRRRDIRQLRNDDPEFEQAYRDARGYSADRIVGEITWIAFDRGNPSQLRALQTLAKGDPELQAMVNERIEHTGRIELQPRPMADMGLLTVPEQELFLALLEKASPPADGLPPDARPALELLAGPRADAA
jgi:hypothetical protein